jgi:recombination protein RecA
MDEVMSRLDKKTLERVQKASEVSIEYLETPIPSLNKAMGGGLPYGRQVLFYGNKSCGKTSMIMQMVATAQKAGKSVLWVDVEKTFDPEWAERLGVDVDAMRVIQLSDSMRVTNDVSKFMDAGVDIVVIDSITAIVPMAYFEKDSIDLKGLEATRQMGSAAKDLGEAIKLWNQSNDNTLLILISQLRNKLGSMYVSQTPTGGNAPMFFSSTVVKLFSSESMKQAIMGEVQLGDYIHQEPIGRKVTWTLENSKTSKPFQDGQYDFYFDGPFVGADGFADVIDTAIRYGIINKSGPSWFKYGEFKFQGRDKVVSHFRALPDDYEVLKKEVEGYGLSARMEAVYNGDLDDAEVQQG